MFRFAIALAASALCAQQPDFQIKSHLVVVPVTVTDRQGRPAEGLLPEDFTILDNGRPRPLELDESATAVAPIALIVAVQSSGISEPVLAKVRRIGAMIQPLITGSHGCAALVSFAARIRWHQECTSDPDAIARAFASLEAGSYKEGRMLDTAHDAIARLRLRPKSRRILLLIAESRDRGSESTLDSVISAAQTADITIYAATYSAFKTAFTARPSRGGAAPPPPYGPPQPRKEPGSPPGREHVPNPPTEQRVDILGGLGELARLSKVNDTQTLTAETGGAIFPFTKQRGLEDAIAKLGEELHSQYTLSFRPDGAAPGYHNLQVRIARAGYQVRARPGYWQTAP